MSSYAIGDKVKILGVGGEREIEAVERTVNGLAFYRLKHSAAWFQASDLTPAAPPKLGKVRVVLLGSGEAVAYAEAEGSNYDSPRHGRDDRFDRILDLDALDADKRRAAELTVEIIFKEAELESANDSIRSLQGQLDRLRAAPADLVPMTVLVANHHLVVGSWEGDKEAFVATIWKRCEEGRLAETKYLHPDGSLRSYAHRYPTVLDAWKAASDHARKEAK